MNIWNFIPRSISANLLSQPIPDSWKNGIERSLSINEAEAINQKLDLGWKRNYNMIAALVILVVSAFIVFVVIT